MSTASIQTAPRIETREDLENALHTQNQAIAALGNLVQAMNERITLLTALLDNHHQIFIDRGWAKPRPGGGGSLAN